MILESVKFETETISPTVRSLNSDSGKVLFTTLEFCFTIKIRSFTFVSCMISTIIPRYFQTVIQILFSAHINNSESDKSFQRNTRFYILIWRILKVHSSRSRADDSEEEVYKLLMDFKAWSMSRKLRSLILPRVKKIDHQTQHFFQILRMQQVTISLCQWCSV